METGVNDHAALRRKLLTAVAFPTTFGLLHHLDHVLREATGWPLIADVNPFTFSLLIYPVVAIGVYYTLKGKLWAGYWLAVALAGLALILPVHLGPVADDSFPAILRAYHHPALGILAVLNLLCLMGSLVGLVYVALKVHQQSGRW